MKNISVLFIGVLMCFSLLAQNHIDEWYLRSFNSSLNVAIEEGKEKQYWYEDYGKIEFKTESLKLNYSYQSQEYSYDLGIVFFPSRCYSPYEKRFLTPDPKSQYYSSYLFVGADPLNIIDRDGNDGKPLFLFQEEFNEAEGQGLSKMMDNVKAVYGDGAYYEPFSKFLNEEITDLPEWSGDVFIMSHMCTDPDFPINAELASNFQEIETEMMHEDNEVMMELVGSEKGELYGVYVNGEFLGAKMKTFSEDMGVPLNSVTLGGCEGEFAAGAFKHGFESIPSKKFHGHEVRASGLQRGYQPVYSGARSGHPEMNMRFKPIPPTPMDEWTYPVTPPKRGASFYPTMKGNQRFKDYVEHGRVGKNFKTFFSTFSMKY